MATYKKVMNKLDSLHPARLLAVRRGRRGRRRASSDFAVGQLVAARRQRVRPARRGQLGAGQPLRAGARRRRARARRVRHGRRHRHAGRAPGRGRSSARPPCVIGLGLVGQLVVQLLVAAGVQVVGLDTVDDALPAGRGGRCAAVRRARRRRASAASSSVARRAHRRPRRRPRLPRRRRRHQRPGRARRPAGPGPGPRRRHRQDAPRPAVERLLREGARRPVLALVRARPLRRPLRAARASTTRPATCAGPSGATWAASSTCWPRLGRRRAAHLGRAARSPTRPTSTSGSRTGALQGVGFLFEYPRRRPTRRRGRRCRSHGGPAGAADRGRATGRRPRTVRLGFIGAGNYASSMLLPHLRSTRDVDAGARGHDDGRCRPSTPSASSASQRPTTDVGRRARRPGDRRRVRRDPAPLARGVRLPRPSSAGKAVFVEKPLALTDEQLDGDPRRRRDDRQRPAHGRLQPALRPAARRAARALRHGAARRRRCAATWSTPAGWRPTSWYLDERARGLAVRRRGRPLHRHARAGGSGSDPVEVSAVGTPGAADVQVDARASPTARSATSPTPPAAARAFPRRRSTSRPAAGAPGSTTSARATVWTARRQATPSGARAARTRASGPSSTRSVEAVRTGARDADRRSTRWSPPPARRSRSARAWRPSGTGDPVSRAGPAGTRAGCGRMSPAEVGHRPASATSRAGALGARARCGRATRALPARGPAPPTGVRGRGCRARPGAQRRRPTAARGLVARRRPAARRRLGGARRRRGPTSSTPTGSSTPSPGAVRPDAACAFRIDHRDETVTGNVKQVWELVPAPPPHRARRRVLAHRRRAATPRRSPTSCARGGAPTRSCPACTGPAASSSASG